jgi:hypothetical protein
VLLQFFVGFYVSDFEYCDDIRALFLHNVLSAGFWFDCVTRSGHGDSRVESGHGVVGQSHGIRPRRGWSVAWNPATAATAWLDHGFWATGWWDHGFWFGTRVV